MPIGLIVTVNKYKSYYESAQYNCVCDSLDEARVKLIEYLFTHFKDLNIDFPMELDDFQNIWFNQTYVKADVFRYKVFHNDKWDEPWEYQDIYSDVMEQMIATESANPPDFSKIYGEPDPDEEVDITDDEKNKGFFENDEISDFEKKLQEIMENAKSPDSKTNFNTLLKKACACEDCSTCNSIEI